MDVKEILGDVEQKSIAIVGAGLVGTLNAIFLAKKGYTVDIYEARKDVRKLFNDEGRSINLSLSTRGLEALKAAGVDGPIIEMGIRGYGRMIHSKCGAKRTMFYGSQGENLLSVNRKKLSEYLVNVADQFPNVRIHFEHKLTSLCLEKPSMTLTRPDETSIEVVSDVILGNDGAYSRVRREMTNKASLTVIFDVFAMPCKEREIPTYFYRIICKQEFSVHKYKELHIPAKDGQFPMEEHFVHLWPRQTFLLIALPNTDRSFTCTLLMPDAMFQKIKTQDHLVDFFMKNFPDAFELMGEKSLLERYFVHPPSPLVSVKCNCYHVKDKIIIMGDAAHAMVPFYAQGMNCAFEDCLIFNGLLDKHNRHFGKVFEDFSATRCIDAHAICDLSYYNYLEMRSLVNSRIFLAKTCLTKQLSKVMPGSFIPLYHMVAFSRIPYNEVVKQWHWQNKMVNRLVCVIVGLIIIAVLLILANILSEI